MGSSSLRDNSYKRGRSTRHYNLPLSNCVCALHELANYPGQGYYSPREGQEPEYNVDLSGSGASGTLLSYGTIPPHPFVLIFTKLLPMMVAFLLRHFNLRVLVNGGPLLQGSMAGCTWH